MEKLDPYDYDTLSGVFGIAPQLAQEVEFINDEEGGPSPELRWQRVRAWVAGQIKPVAP
jgi:hypothetical protein